MVRCNRRKSRRRLLARPPPTGESVVWNVYQQLENGDYALSALVNCNADIMRFSVSVGLVLVLFDTTDPHAD